METQARNRLIAALGGGLALFSLCACQESYRIGEHVNVKWCEGIYPAFVIAKKSPTRYRVHLDGYEARWDTDIGFDRIVGLVDEASEAPPPALCPQVARALGIKQDEEDAATLYKAGSKVRVSWRGSVYKATILKAKGADRFLVHYDGHESAWDEVVGSERIVGTAK